MVVESRAAEPIVPPWFWRRRALAGSGLAAIGLGLLVTGPSIFLPTYGQAVLGLGAVAAGAVLAMMSIGWPLASAVSGGAAVLVLVPRRFAMPGAKASAGPGGQAGPAAPVPSTGINRADHRAVAC